MDDYEDDFEDIELSDGYCDVDALENEDMVFVDDIPIIEDLHYKDITTLTETKACMITQRELATALTTRKINFYFSDLEPADLHERYRYRVINSDLHKRDRITQVRPLSAKRLL